LAHLTDSTWDLPELRAWLGLLLVPRLGAVRARRLLAALGSPQAVFAASANVWSDVLGQRWLPAACQPDAALWDEHLQLTQQWLDQSPARSLITLADTRYPWALLEAADPPLLLFAEGRTELLNKPALAVVGSRNATPTGCDNARAFAEALSAAGVTIVSGLAEGIDAAAHQGALASVATHGEHAGSTLAVVGTGADVVYPAKHRALTQQVVQHGLLISEFLLGTQPRPAHFPKRNRVVAGLSQGTLVVEAALQSGSLITARLAADMGREVMAIPGSIHSPHSKGCHALLKQGAKLVETAQDVLEELKMCSPHAVTTTLPEQPDVHQNEEAADPILRAMGFDPVSQEALSLRTGMGPAELGARLLELELMGQVSRLPGLRFQRLARA
jgi:DNA processing protein